MKSTKRNTNQINNMEEWRDIKWYKWKYRVSNKQRIYSCVWTWRILKWFWNKFKRICLSLNGKKKFYLINTLYKDAFGIKVVEYKEPKDYILSRFWKWLQKICSNNSLLFQEEVLSQRRDKYIQQCRYECYRYLRNKWITYTNIWDVFWKNHAAVLYTMRIYWGKDNKTANCKGDIKTLTCVSK